MAHSSVMLAPGASPRCGSASTIVGRSYAETAHRSVVAVGYFASAAFLASEWTRNVSSSGIMATAALAVAIHICGAPKEPRSELELSQS